MTKEAAARHVLEECFWGDYRFDVPSLLAHIDEGSAYFDRFLVDRILKNAHHPSQLLNALYTRDRVQDYLSSPEDGEFLDYHARRRALVRANLSGDYNDPALRLWKWR